MDKKVTARTEAPTASGSEPAAKPTSTHSSSAQFHCPYRQASLLQQALAPDKMRVGFFLGAGCPTAIRVPDGTNTKPLIPDIDGLTKHIVDSIGVTVTNEQSKVSKTAPTDQGKAAQPSANDTLKQTFTTVLNRLKQSGNANPNIEEILSHIRALHDVVGASQIDGLSKDHLASLDKEICKITTEVMNVDLPSDDTPYHHLAAWVGGVLRTHAIELFTPNYDLLIEQALEKQRVPYFDGFVGSDRTFFDLASIEQDLSTGRERDGLPTRWARLWKVHGSINWWRNKSGNIERHTDLHDGAMQMIHPSHLKYDESRRMPYLAMLDRLRNFLLRGQAVLVTCGYSFTDRHLNDVILQGLTGNSTAVCFGLLFGDRSKYPTAVAAARSRANLSLLAVDGAILNTIERDWHSEDKSEHPFCGLASQTGDLAQRSTAPAARCKFLLGDFKAFGQFLAHQLSDRQDREGVKNA